MVSKCANPNCPASFLYLHQGKLFRMAVESGKTDGLSTEIRRAQSHVEFYWLCDDCSATMTLAYKQGLGVLAVPTAAPPLPVESTAPVRSAAVAS
jgi:hypothetical protein